MYRSDPQAVYKRPHGQQRCLSSVGLYDDEIQPVDGHVRPQPLKLPYMPFGIRRSNRVETLIVPIKYITIHAFSASDHCLKRHPRGHALQDFTRIGIHPVLNISYCLLRISSYIRAFWYKASDYSVMIFITATFESAIGMCKVESQSLFR